MAGASADTIESLKARIAALEKRPALAEATGYSPASAPGTATGFPELLRAPAGLLHEVFADQQRDGSAALGFIFGLARPLLTGQRPTLIYLQLARHARELGLPYGAGFSSFGLGLDQVIVGRIETLAELLWAMEEAIACEAVAAVVADLPGNEAALDFTVSRRLGIRTAATRTSAFLLRYGSGREASAARLRWKIAPAVSHGPLFDPQSPGPPRFAVTLEKGRLGAMAQRLEGTTLMLDWVEHGFVVADGGEPDRAVAGRTAAPSGAAPAVLGHRLPKAG